ncbi:Hsp70 family protein [Actinokineospora enzanensis]|uniref:Hsp70 family protein n=1 Tax=Actinokineospora enzanensis TaxID=155975 RepID=UPI0003715C01|nr:Hsp70 family protein [Actinokineospora enzanensis]
MPIRTAEPRAVLGIDLGTTNTCVAVVADDPSGTVVPNAEGGLTTPSAVYLAADGMAAVGESALARLGDDPGRVVTLIKREMGQGHTVEVDGRSWYPQHVSGVILRKVVEDALIGLGRPVPVEGPIADVVITVPAYFGSAEREATVAAGRFAELEVLDLVNEPTAAAVAHGLRSAAGERTVLVYDLGGGTFDVTLVRLSPAELRVVATGGDHRLGGADWDAELAEIVLERVAGVGVDVADLRAESELLTGLRQQVERVKIALSARERCTFTVRDASGQPVPVTVTRAEYEEATAGLLHRTIQFTGDLLDQARGLGVTRVDDVLLVGGMARGPAVARELAAMLPDLPPARPARDAEHIVARGAARIAARVAAGGSAVVGSDGPTSPLSMPLPSTPVADVVSTGPVRDVDSVPLRPGAALPSRVDDPRSAAMPRPDGPGVSTMEAPACGSAVGNGWADLPAITDVTSKGYGVEIARDPGRPAAGRALTWLIRPNDVKPARVTRTLFTVRDDQRDMAIRVYESMTDALSEEVEEHSPLWHGTLRGLPPGIPRGYEVRLDYELGRDGILGVRAYAGNGAELSVDLHVNGQVPAGEEGPPLPGIRP